MLDYGIMVFCQQRLMAVSNQRGCWLASSRAAPHAGQSE
jgi:hypothetical protein